MCVLPVNQVTLSVGPNQDLAILHEVKRTNSRTKKVQEELLALKRQIFGLENELRFCWDLIRFTGVNVYLSKCIYL